MPKKTGPRPYLSQQQQQQQHESRGLPYSSSNNRRRNGTIGTLGSLAVVGATGYLVWKYALASPTNLDEAQDGLSNLTDKASQAWDDLDIPYIPSIDLSNFTDVLAGISDEMFGELFGGDPMLGDNTTYNWNPDFVYPSDGGLRLTLQNALDDTWQGEFEAAVSDWQESDALVLTAERVEVDYNCNRIDGVMVVCNANFGETGWVGINENAIMDNIIVSSVAKMNEYYLRNADFDHRRYTMCHEIGHGFGLPHTDENQYNANIGNCLDYTDSPSTNMYPGDVNMAKLREMYLTQRRRKVRADGTVIETTILTRRNI
jgi:predicted Zn-dependent protease